MANKPSKAEHIAFILRLLEALADASEAKSSDGGVESRHAECAATGVHPTDTLRSAGAGVAPGPSETKPTRRGRPRIGEVREKPWLLASPPMSERTWYRRQREQRPLSIEDQIHLEVTGHLPEDF